MNKIFTFWEPKEKLPGYVKLCMRTWEKYLSDSEVVVCDYETTKEYLSEDEFAAVDFRQMPLAKQSDAIRCALLKKHGGIWMDADVIMSDNVKGKGFKFHDYYSVYGSVTYCPVDLRAKVLEDADILELQNSYSVSQVEVKAICERRQP